MNKKRKKGREGQEERGATCSNVADRQVALGEDK